MGSITKVRAVAPTLWFWLAAGVALVAVDSFLGHYPTTSAALMSLLGAAHGLHAFWRHGGSAITAVGVLMVGIVTFVYFPGIYLSIVPPDFADEMSLYTAVTTIYFSHILVYYLFCNLDEAGRAGLPSPKIDAQVASWTFNLGIALMAGGYGLQRVFGLGSTTLVGAAAFVGATCIAIVLLQNSERLSIARLALAAGVCGVYVITMFSGGGRLVLGGLAMTVAIAMARNANKIVKLGVLTGVPVGLIVLANNRASRTAAISGNNESGLESVIWPLERFAQLLQMSIEGRLDLALGSTFYSSAVHFVPRSLWPSKPNGLGSELTILFRPEIADSGHSEAALLFGELVYNFGVLGLVALIPILAWMVNRLDQLLYKSQQSPLLDRRLMLVRIAAVLAVAGLLDLIWVGTFGYMSRTGQRLLILGLVYLAFAWKTHSRNALVARRSDVSSPSTSGDGDETKVVRQKPK